MLNPLLISSREGFENPQNCQLTKKRAIYVYLAHLLAMEKEKLSISEIRILTTVLPTICPRFFYTTAISHRKERTVLPLSTKRTLASGSKCIFAMMQSALENGLDAAY